MRSLRLRPLSLILPILALLGSGQAVAQDTARTPLIRAETAEVNGIQLHYRTGGAGPPLLLLHGFLGAGSWWDPLTEDLSKRHTLIIPDLPLHARSTGHPGSYRYRDVAADLYALPDQLGIDRTHAIGYSAGGIILLHMATQQPRRIEAMSLVSAAHLLTEPNRKRLRQWPEFEACSEAMRAYTLRVHPGGERQVRSLLKALRSMPDVGDNMSFTPEDLSRIQARTLLAIGDRDTLVPVELGVEMYRAIPNAALWVVILPSGRTGAARWMPVGFSRVWSGRFSVRRSDWPPGTFPLDSSRAVSFSAPPDPGEEASGSIVNLLENTNDQSS